MTKEENKLLPCPFCDGEAKANVTDAGVGYQTSRVRCTKCPAEVSKIGLNAEDFWNTRPQPAIAAIHSTPDYERGKMEERARCAGILYERRGLFDCKERFEAMLKAILETIEQGGGHES